MLTFNYLSTKGKEDFFIHGKEDCAASQFVFHF
jgi:hypothetical protein